MSKEAMKLALEAAYLAGFNASGEGYNGEYPFQGMPHPAQDEGWCQNRDAYIREALAEQPAQQDQGWKADVQKVRDALDPEDWCGDERMIDVLDRALAQKPCCSNMAAGTSCLADPNPNCPMLAAPQPAQQQEPVAWGNFKEDGTLVGLSQHPEDQANWTGRKPFYTSPQPAQEPLTPAQKIALAEDWFAEDWAITKAVGMMVEYEMRIAHGITKGTK